MDNHSTNDFVPPLVIGVAAAVFIGWYWLWHSHAKTILRQWANDGGFEILDCDRRYNFGTGSFRVLSAGRPPVVFHVRVRDGEGRERKGWVHCGSYFGGVFFSNRAEVRWD